MKRINLRERPISNKNATNLYKNPNYKKLVKHVNSNTPSHTFNLVAIYVGSLKLFLGWTLLTVVQGI